MTASRKTTAPEKTAVPQKRTLSEAMHTELHELCQPVQAVQACLEIGRTQGSPDALDEAVQGALQEMTRVFESVGRMRQRLDEADAEWPAQHAAPASKQIR